MEREVSSSIHLSVTLMAIAIVLSLVMYTVFVGSTVRTDLAKNAVQLQEGISTGQLNSLSGDDERIMAKSAIYFILTKEYDGVVELDYSYLDVYSNIVGGAYIVNSKGYWTVGGGAATDAKLNYPYQIMDAGTLDGKVSVVVTRVGRGSYKVIIRDVDLYN